MSRHARPVRRSRCTVIRSATCRGARDRSCCSSMGWRAHWTPGVRSSSRSRATPPCSRSISQDMVSSSPAGGDYSLGSLATFLRDVLMALGHDHVTLVGHSLGGGIAMQFSYQFPEMTERLVLVSSGGLGLEVNPALRAASLPGADLFLSLTAGATKRASGIRRTCPAGRARPVEPRPRGAGAQLLLVGRRRPARGVPGHRRSVVGLSGQTVRAGDRLHLASELPVLLIWGADDPIIPVEHARAAHELLPQHARGVRRRAPLPARRGARTVRRGAAGVLRQRPSRRSSTRRPGGHRCGSSNSPSEPPPPQPKPLNPGRGHVHESLETLDDQDSAREEPVERLEAQDERVTADIVRRRWRARRIRRHASSRRRFGRFWSGCTPRRTGRGSATRSRPWSATSSAKEPRTSRW